MVILVYIPNSSVRGFSFFPKYSPTPVVSGVTNDGYSNMGEVES
jgi:hypothetical protein